MELNPKNNRELCVVPVPLDARCSTWVLFRIHGQHSCPPLPAPLPTDDIFLPTEIKAIEEGLWDEKRYSLETTVE